jgi:hypothetical protein
MFASFTAFASLGLIAPLSPVAPLSTPAAAALAIVFGGVAVFIKDKNVALVQPQP